MQQSRYKIKFINGDLEGRSFAVKDSGLVIGSSMNADIRSSEYGVAEEHITSFRSSTLEYYCTIPATAPYGCATSQFPRGMTSR